MAAGRPATPPIPEKSFSRWAPSPQPRPAVTATAAAAEVQQAAPTHSAAVTRAGRAFAELGKEAARCPGWGRSAEDPVLVYVRAVETEAGDALGF